MSSNYNLINYDSAQYLYEVGESPKWLIASQALSMIYQDFSTTYQDMIVEEGYLKEHFQDYFSKKELFFATLGKNFGSLTPFQETLLW
jgi:hypothetical protein